MKPTPGMNISRQIIRVLKPLIDKFPAVGLAYRTWRDTLIGYYCCIALSLGKKVIASEPIPRKGRKSN